MNQKDSDMNQKDSDRINTLLFIYETPLETPSPLFKRTIESQNGFTKVKQPQVVNHEGAILGHFYGQRNLRLWALRAQVILVLQGVHPTIQAEYIEQKANAVRETSPWSMLNPQVCFKSDKPVKVPLELSAEF